MRAMGVVFVVLGLLALVYGGFTYTKREKVIDLGPIEATTQEKRHLDFPPIAGGLAVVAGTAMILAGGKRRQTA